jgi:fimbrial chaperone protein
MAWSASGVEEVLTDNNELLLNPPIFTLKPGQSQFMRVGLRRPPNSSAETTYRLILEETPPPPKPGFTGVTTLLKISIPIFVNPAITAPTLEWASERMEGNKIRLRVENRGDSHIQIKSLTVRGSDAGREGIRKNVTTNVLRGGRKEWVIEPGLVSGTGPLSIEATTDRGIVRAVVEPKSR